MISKEIYGAVVPKYSFSVLDKKIVHRVTKKNGRNDLTIKTIEKNSFLKIKI